MDPITHLTPPITHWCVQAGHPLPTQRKSFLGSEGEQADDLSTGSTPTGNVEGSFAFIVSCGEGLVIQFNRIHAHKGKSMCVCLSFRCEPMMWQSSMIIKLPETISFIINCKITQIFIHSHEIAFLKPFMKAIFINNENWVGSQVLTGHVLKILNQNSNLNLQISVYWLMNWPIL